MDVYLCGKFRLMGRCAQSAKHNKPPLTKELSSGRIVSVCSKVDTPEGTLLCGCFEKETINPCQVTTLRFTRAEPHSEGNYVLAIHRCNQCSQDFLNRFTKRFTRDRTRLEILLGFCGASMPSLRRLQSRLAIRDGRFVENAVEMSIVTRCVRAPVNVASVRPPPRLLGSGTGDNLSLGPSIGIGALP